MLRVQPFLVLGICFLSLRPAFAQAEQRSLVLELQATKEFFAPGSAPTFRLKIRNDGKAAEKVLKLRGDLQDTYFDLEVRQGGRPVTVPRAISDPGPITDADYVSLAPGESLTYELKRFASAWDRLSVGEYTAVVRFWRPGEPYEKSYPSSEVKFKVGR